MTSLVALTCLLFTQAPSSSPPGRPAPAIAAADIVSAVESAVADAIAIAEPSVVAIHRWKRPNTSATVAVRGRKPNLTGGREPLEFPDHPPFDGDFISFDFGSGVVIGDRDEILTAFHVVRGAAQLTVRGPGRVSFDAEVIASDPRSDLAVIAPIQQGGADRPRLKPIAIGDASRLRKGSFLMVLGNSFNAARHDGSPSASWGILSNVARKLESEPDTDSPGPARTKKLQEFSTLLQLDAKLNLGMSGGAVINLKGELVGITTTASSPAGFDIQAGYAIPMDRMGRRAVEALKQGKEVEYGLLGITSDPQGSNRVNRVIPNSPAALGLLQDRDELLAVNDRPIADFDSLIVAVSVYGPGDSIRLKLRRSDEIIERTVVLAKAHVDGEIIVTNRPRAWRGLRVDYTSTVKRRVFDVLDMAMPPVGVVVTDVAEGSPAAAADLKEGVVIFRVAERPIHDPRDFARAVAELEGPVVLETDIGARTIGATASDGKKPTPRSRPDR